MVRKTLKRVLDQLRGATDGLFRKRTATRDGLQAPEQLQTLPAPTRARP